MSIAQQLDDALKLAMRERDKPRLSCIRQVRSKFQEALNAPDFDGKANDALYQRVIASYSKSLHKGIAELGGGGGRGAELRAQYQAEIDYLADYLPKKLDEAATRALVEKSVSELGVTDPKQAGRVMGAIMKSHKDEVDAGMVKRLVDAVLTEA